MRAFVLCSFVVVLASSSFASFELALISDRAANVIHRMDPETGSYLGSFGQNFLNGPGGVVLDQATETLFVADNNRITKWNYNTGSFLGLVASGLGTPISFSRNASDGSFNFTTSFGVNRVSAGGALIRTYTAAGTTPYRCGLLANDGLYYVSRNDGSTARLEWQNAATGAVIGVSGWFADRYIPRGGNQYVNLFNVAGSDFFEVDTLNNGVSLNSQFSTGSTQTFAGGAFGHNGVFYTVGKSIANPAVGSIRKVELVSRAAGSLYGTSFLQDPTGIAVVVAPEPGSLGVLAAGLALVVRRRSAKRGS